MKFVVTILILFLQSLFNLDAISDENILKKKAENHYYSNSYSKTIFNLEKLNTNDDNKFAVNLNLAHSFFNLKQYTKAYRIYKKSIQSADKNVQSIALMQLGLIHAITAQEMQSNILLKDKANEHYLKSLKCIKESLLANPENDIARLNYEILANNTLLKNLKLESLIYKPKKETQKSGSKSQKKKPDAEKIKEQNENQQEQNSLGKSEVKSENETEKKGLSAQNNSQETNNKQNKKTNTQESDNGMSAKNVDVNGHLQGGIEKNKGLASDKGKQHGRIEIDKKTDGEEKPQMNKNKLKSMRLSEEAALKLLDEMQQNEKQFLQHYYLKPDVKGKPNYKQKW